MFLGLRRSVYVGGAGMTWVHFNKCVVELTISFMKGPMFSTVQHLNIAIQNCHGIVQSIRLSFINSFNNL